MNAERIRQHRLDMIIAEDAAHPANGPDCQTPHEVAMLAWEVAECRKKAREADHDFRNRVAPFGSVIEMLRTLHARGLLPLAGFPHLLAQVEDCHRLLDSMNPRPGDPGPATTNATEDGS